jgi:hypothetical protein
MGGARAGLEGYRGRVERNRAGARNPTHASSHHPASPHATNRHPGPHARHKPSPWPRREPQPPAPAPPAAALVALSPRTAAPHLYRWTTLDGVGTARVLAADGWTVTEVGVGDGVRAGTDEPVRAVGTGAVLGAVVREERPDSRGRGLTGFGDADVEGPADGPLAGGGASGGTGDTGDCGAADRSGSTTRAPTAHATPTPAAARSSRRRAAPRRIAS